MLQAKGPVNASLSDHFFAKFRRGSQECKAAQRAFAESMAAYSLVCYFLQIKVGGFLTALCGCSHVQACLLLVPATVNLAFIARPYGTHITPLHAQQARPSGSLCLNNTSKMTLQKRCGDVSYTCSCACNRVS